MGSLVRIEKHTSPFGGLVGESHSETATASSAAVEGAGGGGFSSAEAGTTSTSATGAVRRAATSG